MADYKELLRRAVEALPENNGAARRAVYEKARAALVGQLRAINPPLAARDITAHRLQLEDCIRQVEQEASEAVIAGLGSSREEAPPPPPVYFDPPAKKALPAAVAKPVAKPPATPVKGAAAAPAGWRVDRRNHRCGQCRACRAVAGPVSRGCPSRQADGQTRSQAGHPAASAGAIERLAPPARSGTRRRGAMSFRRCRRRPVRCPNCRSAGRLPSIVARAEAAKSRTGASPFGAAIGGPSRGPTLEPRREIAAPRSNQQIAARQLVRARFLCGSADRGRHVGGARSRSRAPTGRSAGRH